MQPIIEVENLSTFYDDQQILKDIYFQIYPNQITVILGKSGCGKTTVLKNLIGLFRPDVGKVKVMNYQLERIEEGEYEEMSRQIGVLFQNGALLNSISVRENISLPLEQHTNLSKNIIELLVKIKLQIVELTGAEFHLPSQLSGGMRKRAALARALALDPPLLFCDEPSAGLDPVTLHALDHLFLKLKDDLGITIVLVTHEIPSIIRLADRIIFLDDGTVAFSGTVSEAQKSGISQVETFFKEGLSKQ